MSVRPTKVDKDSCISKINEVLSSAKKMIQESEEVKKVEIEIDQLAMDTPSASSSGDDFYVLSPFQVLNEEKPRAGILYLFESDTSVEIREKISQINNNLFLRELKIDYITCLEMDSSACKASKERLVSLVKSKKIALESELFDEVILLASWEDFYGYTEDRILYFSAEESNDIWALTSNIRHKMGKLLDEMSLLEENNQLDELANVETLEEAIQALQMTLDQVKNQILTIKSFLSKLVSTYEEIKKETQEACSKIDCGDFSTEELFEDADYEVDLLKEYLRFLDELLATERR